MELVAKQYKKLSLDAVNHLLPFLNKRIWGETWEKHPIHVNEKEKLLINNPKTIKLLNGKRLREHWQNLETFYYTAEITAIEDKKYILLMIDVDVQKSQKIGSSQGAKNFINFIKTNYFPDLYTEPSTGGKGQHGYILLEVTGVVKKEIKEYITQLQDFLRNVVYNNNFDIELVEITGHPSYVKNWNNLNNIKPLNNLEQYYEIEEKIEVNNFSPKDINMGKLAKIPRDIVQNLQAFKNTTRISIFDIADLQEKITARPKIIKLKQNLKGSNGSKIFNENELMQLSPGGVYYNAAIKLMNNKYLKTKTSRNVIFEDMAVVLMLGKFFSTTGKNNNNAMPFARFKELHNAIMDDCNVLNINIRGFDNNRFAVCRNYLSELNLLTWEDETYSPAYIVNGEIIIDGKCCKWTFSEELISLLSPIIIREREEASLVRHDLIEEPIKINNINKWTGILPILTLKINEFHKWRDKNIMQETKIQEELRRLGLVA